MSEERGKERKIDELVEIMLLPSISDKLECSFICDQASLLYELDI